MAEEKREQQQAGAPDLDEAVLDQDLEIKDAEEADSVKGGLGDIGFTKYSDKGSPTLQT